MTMLLEKLRKSNRSLQTGITEKTASKNVSKIQHLISGTMASGRFAKSMFKKGAAASA